MTLKKTNKTMFSTSFRDYEMSVTQESDLSHLLDIYTAIKQQVLLRRALSENKEMREKMIRFPIDCPNDCPHHKQWDLSVDDYTHYCDLLKAQIDEFDYGFIIFLICPKEDES